MNMRSTSQPIFSYLNAAFLLALFLVGCGGSSSSVVIKAQELADYNSLLSKFPEGSVGVGLDVFTSGQTEQPETLAFVLKGEAIQRTSSARVHEAVARLLALSDLDGDGTIGWGIDQAWDAFGDGTTNPRNQVYIVSNAIVLDGLLAALDEGVLNASEVASVSTAAKNCILSSLNAFTEQGGSGYFWYSTNPNDAIYVPNVNAYICGVIQKALHQHASWFSATEISDLGNRVDRAVTQLIGSMRTVNGTPYWAYVNMNFSSPNDLVHHGYTLLGLEMYRQHSGRVSLPYNQQQAVDSYDGFLKNGIPTEYPQNEPGVDASLLNKPARVWTTGFTIDVLLMLGATDRIEPYAHALLNDYGVFPDVRYTPILSTPPPEDKFFPRIVAHCLPGLSRRAGGSLRY